MEWKYTFFTKNVTKITNWPIKQLRNGSSKKLPGIKVVYNSILGILVKTRSLYDLLIKSWFLTLFGHGRGLFKLKSQSFQRHNTICSVKMNVCRQLVVVNRSWYHHEMERRFFTENGTKIANCPIKQLRNGSSKKLPGIKVVYNSIVVILLKTRSLYDLPIKIWVLTI